MKIRQERTATGQFGVRSDTTTKANDSATRPVFVFRAPLLASLALAVSLAGCAKNRQDVNEANTVQQTNRQTDSQSETPSKPLANPFLGLQDAGPFIEPVCQAPDPQKQSQLASHQSAPNQNQASPSSHQPTPQTYHSALEALRNWGFASAAGALESRVNQVSQKMKLDEKQAAKLSNYLVNDLSNMPNAGELEKTMPKSVVELVVAVEERGVSREEAEKIADFLLRFTAAMRFGNPGQFDSNLSHVIGREWSQIDYSGEGTTWQKRKKQWAKYGVPSFKKAEYIENYFRHEKELSYFTNIYRPEGQWP